MNRPNTHASGSISWLARSVLGVLLLMPVAFPAMAVQEPGTWEYAFFGGRANPDSALVLEDSEKADFYGDGDPVQGMSVQTLDYEDDLFAGLRIGFVWLWFLESEISWDRNHTSAEYTVEGTAAGQTLEYGQNTVSSIITTYQLSASYLPLGNWKTRWQPFVQLGTGYVDADMIPSGAAADAARSYMVEDVIGAEMPINDSSMLLTYGLGLKWFFHENGALRADWRVKRYTIFDEKRTDREITFGVSFFIGGEWVPRY